MPEVDFWEEYVEVTRRNKQKARREKFMNAVLNSDSAAIDECLKEGGIDINEKDGKALSILLDKHDYINAVKLLDAGAQLFFQHDFTEYDPNDCYPYTKTVTEFVSLLDGRGSLTRADIYQRAQSMQQDVTESISQNVPKLR